MQNTKVKFISFVALSILCIIAMVISALFYIELQGSEIFGIIDAKPDNLTWSDVGSSLDTPSRRSAYALISIGFTISALLFCIAIAIFIYYIIAASNNRKLIKIIREIKEQYSIKHKIAKEEIDAGLLEIREQIKKFEKTNVKPIQEVEIKKGKKEKKAKKEEKKEEVNQTFPAKQVANTPTAPLA